jgi:hypothetical protein
MVGGAAMTTSTSDVQAQVRALREQTIAAIEQRDVLAAEARRAVIAAWEQEWICRNGCADALTGWGLAPPPGELTVSAVGRMSYTRLHPDDDEARDEARHHVPDELLRLLPMVDAWPTRVIEVTPDPDGDDYPEAHPYRITVQITLRAPVTATSQAAAIDGATALVNARMPELADADITLTGLVWEVYDGPDDLIHTDTGAKLAPVPVPEVGADLTAVTAAHAAATEALAELRRRIRRRAIRALADDEFSGVYEETAERVEEFLHGLGLAGLPRAHHITVTADVRLRLCAATSDEAYLAMLDTMRPTTARPSATQAWNASGWPTGSAVRDDDGRWLVGWRHEYELGLRGHTEPTEATAAAEALARADLTRTLAGTAHDLVDVNVAHLSFGIDEHLDPDID